MKKTIVILTSHPIQYNAPFFKYLNSSKHIKPIVIYTQNDLRVRFDIGFRKKIQWDINLLEGYEYYFLKSQYYFGFSICKRILRFNPDAILVYGWNFFIHILVMYRLNKKLKVFFFGDSILRTDHLTFLKRRFLKEIFTLPQKIFYVGKSNREYYKAFEVNESQLHFMPHAIDINRFITSVKDEDVKLLRKKFNIVDTDFVFMYMGKFQKNKNVELLIQAFLMNKIPNSKLLLVGSGMLLDKYKRLTTGSSDILYTGFINQSDIPCYYALASCVVLPSKGPETWGLVINEAVALNKRIIVSNTCGCGNELVVNGVNGYVFKSNGLKELSSCMHKVTELDEKKLLECNAQLNSIYSFKNKYAQLINALDVCE